MILTCPECATSYFVPDDSLGPNGRRVRCQSCAHTWRATPHDEPLELTAPAAEPEPASFGKRDDLTPESLAEAPAPELPKAFRARAEQQRRMRRAAAVGGVWAGLACLFVGLLGAAWLFRVQVVELYPRTAAAYAAVGAPVNPVGLEFASVRARPARSDPAQVLVSGALRNVRDRPVAAPVVRIALLDGEGREIGHQMLTVPGPPIEPGAVLGFATLAPDPEARVADIGVAFDLDARPAPAPAPTPPAPAPVQVRAEPVLRGPIGLDRPGAVIEAEPLDTLPREALSASHG
jgi:predicted Zn finger-like uncharacterized protein